MIILEKSDDLHALSEVGLNPSENGFYGSVPEAVEEIIMPGFSVYQVSNAYDNEYMPIFYLAKREFEGIFEFQEYLKRWTPDKIQFKPKGDWQQTQGKWLFSGPKYKTQGVDLHVSEQIQSTIWTYIATRKESGKVPLDYLQIFNLRSEKVGSVSMQVIECSQEVPPYKFSLSFPSKTPVNEKIFVIDDVDHQTMLMAREY